jgi:hypothetical protein
MCGRCGARLRPEPRPAALAYAPPLGAYAAGEAPAATLPLDFPVRPFASVGDVLAPTFKLYREHLGTVAKIVLVAAPVQGVLDYLMAQPEGPELLPVWLTWLASAGVGSLVTGALVYAVMTLLRTGGSPPLKESLAWGLRKWWKLMACLLLVSVLAGLGTMLLCVPGIILMVVSAVALPSVAVEDLGPFAALKRSVLLTAGYRGLVFVTLLLMWLLLAAAIWLMTATASPLAGAGALLLMSLVYAAVTQIIYSINTVVSLFIYLSLRVSRGDVDAPAALHPAPPAGQLP